MAQIKVTPEELERIAKRASDTKHVLESIHNGLYNQIEHLAYQWNGASMQKFHQDFNQAKSIAFTATNAIANTEEELKRIAEKFRKADSEDVTVEKGAMCGPSSSEKEGFDGKKLARDIAGELTGEYDVRRVWDGVDPSTGEKLSIWNRFLAGGMVLAGLTPVGKAVKVGKGVKMSADVAQAAKAAEKASEAAKVAKGVGEAKTISHPVLDNTRTGSALKPYDGQHGFNDIIDNYAQYAKEFDIVGGDGISRKLYQIEGAQKSYEYKQIYDKTQRFNRIERVTEDQKGVFEWIVDPTNGVTHRRFIPNGKINGIANQRP